MAVMLSFVVWSLAGLLAALFLLGRSRPMSATPVTLPPRDDVAALAGVICFGLVLLEIARLVNGWPAAIAALIAGTVFLRRRIFSIDYSIVPLFFFAFIVVEGLREMHVYRGSANLYVTSIALSQVISNVPATILLSPLAGGRWQELLYGVNAGGCGTIIASLANLLGWAHLRPRIESQEEFLLAPHGAQLRFSRVGRNWRRRHPERSEGSQLAVTSLEILRRRCGSG